MDSVDAVPQSPSDAQTLIMPEVHASFGNRFPENVCGQWIVFLVRQCESRMLSKYSGALMCSQEAVYYCLPFSFHHLKETRLAVPCHST